MRAARNASGTDKVTAMAVPAMLIASVSIKCAYGWHAIGKCIEIEQPYVPTCDKNDEQH